MQIGLKTDTGRVRDRNEDSAYGLIDPNNHDKAFIALADGMGGLSFGERASATAMSTLAQWICSSKEGEPAACLEEGFQRAHESVAAQAEALHAVQSGMGPTLLACLIDGNSVVVANVGDSRAYVIREGKLTQLTKDHNLAAEGTSDQISHVNRGALRNVLTRSIGGHAVRPEIDKFRVRELEEADQILLCSDGLYSHVSDKEIHDYVGKSAPQKAVERFVRVANTRGGSDNISVVVARL